MNAPQHFGQIDDPGDRVGPEARALLALAWPVILSSLNWTLLHIVDIAFVGQAGTAEVAAFGASRALTYIAIVAGLSAQAGVLVYTARADGAGDRARTGQVLRSGLLLGAACGLAACLILILFATTLLRAIGVAEALIPVASAVVRIMAFCYPASLVMTAGSYWLEGISKPRAVMAVNLGMLPVNGVLAWALSGGHLGFPVLGAVGAALATLISVWGGAIFMAVAVLRSDPDGSRRVRDNSPDAWCAAWRAVPQLAKFGLVPAVAAALELGGFAWLIALSTQLGDEAAHAFQIVFTLHNLTFSLALGMGSAVGVRVGNAVGAGHPEKARRRTLIAGALSMGLTAVAAVTLAAAAVPLTGAYPATANVHRLAASMLVIWAPFILFDGVQVVFNYALRSLGDQVAAGLASVCSFFIVTGGLGWLLVHNGLGPYALVIASGSGMVVAALLMGARLLWVTSGSHPKN
ncbi:MATE family efflux transporter [Sphingomonas sp.]|uniref:MATE family efflux transporter n=1 Tax=Sphingomonas sp. TaxID=28214 RepID=UPI0025F8C346|nr:MATE family efflux transporter [Sphingomonas sp.]